MMPAAANTKTGGKLGPWANKIELVIEMFLPLSLLKCWGDGALNDNSLVQARVSDQAVLEGKLHLKIVSTGKLGISI